MRNKVSLEPRMRSRRGLRGQPVMRAVVRGPVGIRDKGYILRGLVGRMYNRQFRPSLRVRDNNLLI